MTDGETGRPLRAGVFGTGHLGRHHVRLLAGLDGSELVGIHDPSPEAARAMADQHGAVIFPDPEELAGQIEVAVVAAPTVHHAELATLLFEHGVHVMVEKPITRTLEEADRLVAAAEAAGRVLSVGHVEFHNPAVAALLATGIAPRFVEVQRLSPFTPRSLDVDVVLDLMIHDLQILHALDPSPVAEVRATGVEVLSDRIDMANARVALESGCVANLTASRVSSAKVRKLRVFGPSRYVSVDYSEQEIKGYRLAQADGEREIVPDTPSVETAEPLRRELEAFLAACRGEASRSVSGVDGRRALATALAVVDAIRA